MKMRGKRTAFNLLKRIVSVLRRDERGVYVVEFALLAFPFFGLLFAFGEVSYVNFEQDALQRAVNAAARSVVTGSAQGVAGTGGLADNAADFAKNYIKPYLPSNLNYQNLIIDVRTAADFATAGTETNASFYNQPLKYCLGSPSTIVVLRVVYPLPAVLPLSTYSPLLGLVNDAPNQTPSGLWSHLLLATEVFETEPYTSSTYTAPSGC